jgi:ParB-like chromosome segregation protein Spo0J
MKGEKTPLAVRYVALDALIPYARNSRTHSDEQIAQLAASLREFGFTNPVLVDAENGIIAGHGRVLAARKLGLTEVPVIELAHMTDAQRRAYVMADNRLAESAGWDKDLLSLEVADLTEHGFDVSLIGFSQKELADMLVGPEFSPDAEANQGKLDEKKPITCPSCGHEF